MLTITRDNAQNFLFKKLVFRVEYIDIIKLCRFIHHSFLKKMRDKMKVKYKMTFFLEQKERK